MLEEVEGRAFALEQDDRRSLDPGELVPFAEGGPVPEPLDEDDRRVDLGENPRDDVQAGQNALFLGQEKGLGPGVGGDNALRGDVAFGHVLSEGGVDGGVHSAFEVLSSHGSWDNYKRSA